MKSSSLIVNDEKRLTIVVYVYVYVLLVMFHQTSPVATLVTTAQLRSTKPDRRFWEGSNPACGVSEIRDEEDF